MPHLSIVDVHGQKAFAFYSTNVDLNQKLTVVFAPLYFLFTPLLIQYF